MKIAIGNDHAGFEYKTAIIEHLKDQGHEIINFGTDSPESADYADFIQLGETGSWFMADCEF